MTKYIKYLLLIIFIALVGYNSVYIKKLSAFKVKSTEKFDAAAFTQKLWDEKLPERFVRVISIGDLIYAIEKDKEMAFEKYSNTLAIGNYRYALVKVQGVTQNLNENDIIISVPHSDSLLKINLATEFIYGNAIRDASGLVALQDFPNTGDLNNISEAFNKIVRQSVLPPFKAMVKQGDKVKIIAAVELNKEHIKWEGLELVPLNIQIIK